MTKIVRTKTRAEGGITPDERTHMNVIAQRWIDIAMRTDPIDPEKIGSAIRRLYAAAGIECKRVIIVPSPLVMAFAYGAAAWIWHCRKNGVQDFTYTHAATDAATHAATHAATDAATHAATYVATGAATGTATDAATRAATYAATLEATRAATYVATGAATRAATYAATLEATRAAMRAATDAATYAAKACMNLAGAGGIACSNRWYASYQGGNMWAALPAYIQAAREVLGLDLPQFELYQAWEDCALEGGFRVMHDEFCLVSDFPLQIHKDDQNRPHNDVGPSHEWRDGWQLWHIHGVRVTEQIVMYPDTLTPEQIDTEMNAEVRRVMIERFGTERYLLESGAKPVQQDDYGVLYRRDVRDDEPIVMVRLLNSTPEPDGVLSQQEAEAIFGCDSVQRRLDTMRAIGHPIGNEPRFKAYMLRVPPDVKTAHEAVAWTFGKDSQSYAPSVES